MPCSVGTCLSIIENCIWTLKLNMIALHAEACHRNWVCGCFHEHWVKFIMAKVQGNSPWIFGQFQYFKVGKKNLQNIRVSKLRNVDVQIKVVFTEAWLLSCGVCVCAEGGGRDGWWFPSRDWYWVQGLWTINHSYIVGRRKKIQSSF